MAFALKLCNLSSMWHNNIHTAAQVYKFKHAANNALKKLPVYCNGHYNRMPDLGRMCDVVEHVGLSNDIDTRREGTRS